MDSIFADIEPYSESQSTWATTFQPISFRSRRAATSRTSISDIDDMAAPLNAAIGDEQADEHQRQKVLQRRIVELEALFFEDYGSPLDAYSRSGFECFIKYSPTASMPLLGAEPGGTIIATWTKGVECLSLRFSDCFHLDFAVTFRHGLDDVRRRWGRSSLGNVFGECPEAKRLTST